MTDIIENITIAKPFVVLSQLITLLSYMPSNFLVNNSLYEKHMGDYSVLAFNSPAYTSISNVKQLNTNMTGHF